jgi:hypothetical protein
MNKIKDFNFFTIQDNKTDDIGGMLIWQVLIDWWYDIVAYQKKCI